MKDISAPSQQSLLQFKTISNLLVTIDKQMPSRPLFWHFMSVCMHMHICVFMCVC